MRPSRLPVVAAFTLALAVAVASPARTARAQDAPAMPAVGAEAPDFTLPGATRYGMLQGPVTLSDFRGKTVVLAFFVRARTKG